MREQFYDQNKSELRQGRPDTWYDPIKSFFGTLPEWDTTLPGTPDDAAYHLSELRKDMTPGEGQLRSGVRSTQEYNKMMGLLDEGNYPEAAAAGIWSGIEAADVGLSAYGLGILATPFDLARRFKSLTPVRPVPKKIHGGDGAYLVKNKDGTAEEITGTFEQGRVNVEDGIKFGVGNPTESIIDNKAAGNKVKVNLFKKKVGWKWVGEPPVDTPTIISVEKGGKHYYTLDSDIGKVDLTKYPNQKSEPRLRPTSRGDLEMGEEVGRINLRGKEHPVYDSIKIVPKKPVVPVSPDAIPKYIDDIPDLTPADLLGKKVFPIHADLTEGGAMYTGIDSSKLDVAEPLLGGKKFPGLETSRNARAVWAVQGNKAKILRNMAESNHVVVVAMKHDAHKGNTTFSNSALKTMDAYVRDGRISKRNLKRLDKLVREPKPSMKVSVKKAVAGFPGFGEKGYQKYLENLSFEARTRIVEQLSKGQKFGAPNIPRIARKLEDPTTYGVNQGEAMILLKLDKGQDNLVELGVHPGTTKHPSYKYGVQGEVVGKFPAPTAYESVFPDFANPKLAKGKTRTGVLRGSDLKAPVEMLTSDKIKNIPFTPLQHIQSSRQAKLALETARGEWISSGVAKTSGGVSPVDFENAIKNSDASSTLTPYTKEDVAKGAKDGSFKVFQLGKAKIGSKGGEGGTSQVFFGIKDTDYNADYGFTHPDLGPNEKAVVGVVNNEPGAKGVAAPGVMGKAIQEGATALDAYAVPSKKYPGGFLPEVYNDYGFVELDRLPFDEKYVRDPKFGGSETKYQDLLEYWRSTGWDESLGMPEMVIMKWKGDDAIRSDAIRLINENGGLNPGSQVGGLYQAAREHSRKSAGLNPQQAPGSSPVNNPGGNRGGIRNSNAPHSSQRYRDVLSELTLLSHNPQSAVQLQNLGLSPESLLY
jgi:hypothetical protein